MNTQDGWIVRKPNGTWPELPENGKPVEVFSGSFEYSPFGASWIVKTSILPEGILSAWIQMWQGTRPVCLAWRYINPDFAKLPAEWLR
jgi:hypothetical protein